MGLGAATVLGGGVPRDDPLWLSEEAPLSPFLTMVMGMDREMGFDVETGCGECGDIRNGEFIT